MNNISYNYNNPLLHFDVTAAITALSYYCHSSSTYNSSMISYKTNTTDKYLSRNCDWDNCVQGILSVDVPQASIVTYDKIIECYIINQNNYV